MKDADAVGETGNPVCGDVMKIYIKIKDDKIKDIKFETLGCAAAIAVSSSLTDIAKGKTLDEALKIQKDDIVKDLGGLPEVKIHCSMLGVEALHQAINKFKKNNN
jgi:nitrogen fixation NifU-like protein